MALLGGIGTLLPRMHEMLMEEHSLPKSARHHISFLIGEMESTKAFFRKVVSSKPPDDNLDEKDVETIWVKQLDELVRHIRGVIDMFRSRVARPPVPPDVFIARIKSMQKIAKARREFARDIRNIRHLLGDLAKRRARYRIDPRLLPPSRLADLSSVEDESRAGVTVELPKDDELHKIRLPSSLKADIAFLKPELEFVKAALDRLAQVPEDELDEGTKAWAEDLREVVCDIKLAVDRFKSATTAKARRRFATDIAELKDSLLEAAERRQRYDLSSLVQRRSPDEAEASSSVDARVDPEKLVAIDGHRDFLVKLLTEEASTSNQQLRIVSIVGLAGVGKTTLANEVRRILAPEFDCTACISLPTVPEPDMKPVLLDLLQKINNPSGSGQHGPVQVPYGQRDVHQGIHSENNVAPDQMNEGDIVKKIHQALHDKRYLIIVEDIWDSTSWDIIKNALIENSKANAVLTTTRRDDVAKYVLTTSLKADIAKYIYSLEPLSAPDSIKLFQERFFFHSKDRCTRELAEKSERLEKCGRIPLAIIVAAGLLANKPWATKGYVDYELLPDKIRCVVADSYNDLPYNLRHCLLYFGMFQKGYVISSEHLVWGWIAEGFIEATQPQTLHEEGESYISELVKHNLIEAVEVDASGKVLFCRVYDSVHEWIISRATADNFSTILDGKQDKFSNEVDRLSIQGNSLEQPLPPEHLSHVRSLIVSVPGDVSMPTLSDFKELSALDLGGCDCLQDDHLKGIDKSFLLKYVVIGGNFITGIPKEIVNLSLLQALDLSASSLNALPECVFMLTKLERLCVSSHMKIPDGIGKMTALQELGDVSVSKAELLRELCCLSKLRILRFGIWSWDESLESYDEPLLEYLNSLAKSQQNIKRLSILTSSSMEFMGKLKHDWAPPTLQMLEIRYGLFDGLTWIDSLQNLSSLSIEVYSLSQNTIDMLGKLAGLRSLSLTSKDASTGNFGLCTDGFRNLTGFRFVCKAMGTIFAAKSKSMQMVKRLKLSFHVSRTNDVNEEFIFGLEDLSSLEHVHVEIICFNASYHVVKKAEDAIVEAVYRGRSHRPELDIRRVMEQNMLEEVVPSNNREQVQKKESAISKKRYYIC